LAGADMEGKKFKGDRRKKKEGWVGARGEGRRFRRADSEKNSGMKTGQKFEELEWEEGLHKCGGPRVGKKVGCLIITQ